MIETITGNVLVFTDMHFGLKQNAVSRLNICVKVTKRILEEIRNYNVTDVIFAGDLFHERVSVNVNTLNVAIKCINAIANRCRTWLIVGNHDSHYKNAVDVNSLNMFKLTANVIVVDHPTQVIVNGKLALLCPWLTDFNAFLESSFDLMIGHFDVSTKYLIASYIEENSKKHVSDGLKDAVDSDKMFSNNSSSATANLIGNFVDIAKPNGLIMTGHIHLHRECVSKGRKFIFIGAPYQLNIGDAGDKRGMYILDKSLNALFVEIDGLPKHVCIKMSDVLSAGIDNYDFSVVKGNILKKTYDVDVSHADDAKVAQKLICFKPYDELIPEYEVAVNIDNRVQDETIALIKKSKLEYIKAYIDSIGKKALDDLLIDANLLYKTLEEYYNKVTDQV